MGDSSGTPTSQLTMGDHLTLPLPVPPPASSACAQAREGVLDREALSRLAARLDIALASVAAGRLDVAELRELVRGLATSPGDSLLLDVPRPAESRGTGASLMPERPSALTSPATLARSLLEGLEAEHRAPPGLSSEPMALKPVGKARLEGRALRTPTRARQLLADWNGMKKANALPAPSGKAKGTSAKALTPGGTLAPVPASSKGSPALPAAGDKENDQPPSASPAGKGGLLKKGAGGGALRLSWKGRRSSVERKASKASRKEAEALSEGGLDLRSEDEESFCGDQPSGLRQSWELPGSRAGGLGLESHDLFLEGASPSKNSLVLTR